MESKQIQKGCLNADEGFFKHSDPTFTSKKKTSFSITSHFYQERVSPIEKLKGMKRGKYA